MLRKSKIRAFILTLAATLLLAGALVSIADDDQVKDMAQKDMAHEGAAPPEMSPEMQAEMAAWMAAAQPGEPHQHLAAMAGKWQGDVSMWMEPGAEAMKSQSATECQMVMDGRFLECTHSGEFGGMPFAGRATEGYNNVDKRYESVWLDNMGTLLMVSTGQDSSDGKSREMTTEFTDAFTGKQCKSRGVYTWIDDDHFKYEMFVQKSGEDERRHMEIVYTRQAG